MATKIVLTGGGTAGHVTPNIALLPALREAGFTPLYIGSKDGIEKKLMEAQGVPYFGIETGKLRRYFDLKNFTDPFRVIRGYGEARRILAKERPDVVFSKGGFVAAPVVRAAISLKIPCVLHESDVTPGLANRLCIGGATFIACNFPETVSKLPEGKAVVTGTPIRQDLFTGDATKGRELCGFTEGKPILLVTGGSQGAARINEAVRGNLAKLTERFQIIHLCGRGKLDESLVDHPGYRQFEFVTEEMKDFMAAADLVLTRGGANAICELLALKKPMLIQPLSLEGSRGDQILNAESFKAQGYCLVVEDNESAQVLPERLEELYARREELMANMAKSPQNNAIDEVMKLIRKAAGIQGL